MVSERYEQVTNDDLIENEIRAYSRAFTDWRYVYENGSLSFSPADMDRVAEALREGIRGLEPNLDCIFERDA